MSHSYTCCNKCGDLTYSETTQHCPKCSVVKKPRSIGMTVGHIPMGPGLHAQIVGAGSKSIDDIILENSVSEKLIKSLLLEAEKINSEKKFLRCEEGGGQKKKRKQNNRKCHVRKKAKNGKSKKKK